MNLYYVLIINFNNWFIRFFLSQQNFCIIKLSKRYLIKRGDRKFCKSYFIKRGIESFIREFGKINLQNLQNITYKTSTY